MMSSRLEPMSTTLMIDHRVYIHSPITGVMCGLHATCGSCDSAVYSFLEPVLAGVGIGFDADRGVRAGNKVVHTHYLLYKLTHRQRRGSHHCG